MQTAQQKLDWSRRNRKKIREQSTAWRVANAEKVKALKRAFYYRNREKILAQQKVHYVAFREERRAKNRARYQKNGVAIRAAMNAERAANREKYREMSKVYRSRRRGDYILYGIKKNCRVKGLAYGLTKEWINTRLAAGTCEMSGIPFDMKTKRGPYSPSVDRINPIGSYTPENCRLIVWFINRAMTNLGEEFTLDVFRKVLARRGEVVLGAR